MARSDQAMSKAGRVLLRSIAIGAAIGFVLGLMGEPALEGSDILGGKFEPMALLYLFFCMPAMGLLPWQVHDLPVLRGMLSGMIWGLLAFGVWWLIRLWKARRQRRRD